ncbi:MAG TPA: ATP phosphoribosyltransferase regulatory subunit, partial [bacterium]
MSPKITAHRAPGTRDFLPDEMALRERVRRVIEETFRLYGFQPLETPATERLEILTGKYGEEADRLIFKILKRGEELESGKASGDLADLGLRYDLTVPLARVVAMHRGELTYPFKRYQIQPVWRAERQQKGRYREFVQCDADIVGSSSVSADAEIIALTDDILQRLRIPGYRIHVNHRMLLQAIAKAAGVPDDRFLEMCVII